MEKSKKLLQWMTNVAELYAKQNCHSTASNYLRTRRSLKIWLRKRKMKDVSLRRVNAELVADYQEWLTVKGVLRNTRAFHLRNFRSAYNKALKEGIISRRIHGNPFEHICTTTIPTHRRPSETDVIMLLEKLDIVSGLIAMGRKSERRSFQKMVNNLTFARDTFLFCFYACGLPFVDFAYLTPDNIRDGILCYGRHKTGSYIEMEILPQMQRFIDRYAGDGPYLFPVLTEVATQEAYQQYTKAIRKYNHGLATLSQMLHLDTPLSTYAARHTWANAVYHNGMPESCIKERLGHASLHTTRSYLKSFEISKIDEMNKQIMDSIFRNMYVSTRNRHISTPICT